MKHMPQEMTVRRRDFLVFLLIISAVGLAAVLLSRLIVAPLGNLPVWPQDLGVGAPFEEQAAAPPSSAAPEIEKTPDALSYRDADLGFRLSYSADFSRTAGNFEGYLPVTGDAAFAVAVNEAVFAGTNLSEALVLVGVSADKQALEFCDASAAGLGNPDGSVVFGGGVWNEFAGSEAAAGSIYDYHYYRTAARGRCYELAEVIHSTNIANYDPGTVREFDRAAVAARLEGITRSFEFVE